MAGSGQKLFNKRHSRLFTAGSASQKDNSKIYEKYVTFVAIRSGNVL
ncbi:hypothetical protein B4096_3576 [Heyndrickxia coagulans]|nr:hypothetical protein B4096_3576 [Heyndrickxia coagulans]